jgi:hypothetical protein
MSVFRDLAYALRLLRKAPGFSLTAVCTLAFGISATTAIFSIVEGVLLRPLPFPDQDQLTIVGDKPEGADFDFPAVTAPEVGTYVRLTHSFSSLGAFQQSGHELSGVGEPAQINDSRLGARVFSVLDVSPLLGRVFTDGHRADAGAAGGMRDRQARTFSADSSSSTRGARWLSPNS